MTDWEDRRLQIKARIAAVDERLEQLSRRRDELAHEPCGSSPATANHRLRIAQEYAAAAAAAVIDELERSVDAHYAAADAHDSAAMSATNDLHILAHTHGAEAHRAAAHQEIELAGRYRRLSQQAGD